MASPWADTWQWVLDVLYVRTPMGRTFLYYAIVAGTLGALALATLLLRVRGGSALGRYARRVAPAYPWVLVQMAIAAAVGVEILFEASVNRALGWDFTPYVFALEGGVVEDVQRLHSGPFGGTLDALLVVVYTWGYLLIDFVPFLAFVFSGRVASARRLALTLALVWGFGLLGYLFLPVNEVWMTAGDPYRYTHVQNLLTHQAPALEPSLIWSGNLNNNLPSLHVAVSFGVAFSCVLSRERAYAFVTVPLACLIAFATVYLGIHWALDVVAGVALAATATWLVHRFEARRRAAGGFGKRLVSELARRGGAPCVAAANRGALESPPPAALARAPAADASLVQPGAPRRPAGVVWSRRVIEASSPRRADAGGEAPAEPDGRPDASQW